MKQGPPAAVHQCDGCGHLMQVPGRYAGTEQRCRRCGIPFTVASAPDAETPADAGVGPGSGRRRLAGCAAAVMAGAALVAAAWLLQPHLGGAIEASDLVRESLVPTVMPVRWAEAPLADGTAVVLNDVAAYWVHDGVVYACDGNAREWSPTAAQAPQGVDALAVHRAVLGHGQTGTGLR